MPWLTFSTNVAPAHGTRTATGLLLLPWLILLVTLGATWLVWSHERQSTQQVLRSQFDFALRETISRIEQRMVAYEQMLRGVQGLLATTDLNNRATIHNYVEELQLDANFSGVKVIGVVQRIELKDKASHLATMRSAVLKDYNIHPESSNDVFAPVIQREPPSASGNSTLGYDVWTAPVRRQALENARDSGMAAISGKVRLAVDQQQDAPPGFIMYLPLFAHGKPRDNVAQRRANLIGWVYAAFHVSDFMASLYGKQQPGLSLSIYDDVQASDATLLYRTTDDEGGQISPQQAALSANEYMVVAGHTWTLSMTSQPAFETRFGRDLAPVIAITGTAFSLALALLVWLMVTGRARAVRLAAVMTEELRHVAQHDPLTLLPNRALFSDRLSQELARAKRDNGHFALIFLDLDNFKPINDTFGHAVGDQVLKQVAHRIQVAIRAVDTVGRIGGDEFVVLIAGLNNTAAVLAMAEKIHQTLRQGFAVNDHQLQISASVGVAVYPDDGSDELTLTRSADEAMYRAKKNGRDNIQMAT
jgi:diguanylate cyclase (GGDEF)-like protein